MPSARLPRLRTLPAFVALSFAAAVGLAGPERAGAAPACKHDTKWSRRFHAEVSTGPLDRFFIEVSGAEVSARLGLDTGVGPARVSVRSAIAFEGTVRPNGALYTTGRAIETLDTMVRILPGWPLTDVRAASGKPVADILMAPGIRATGVPVACEDLSVEAPEAPRVLAIPIPKSGDIFVPRASVLTLRSRVTEGMSLALETADPEDLLMVRDGGRDKFLHLAVSLPGGARISGWARSTDIRQVFDLQGGHAIGGMGGPVEGCGNYEEPTRTPYVGPAVVANGMSVHASPDGPAWGKVRDGNGWKVAYDASRPWTRVLAVPNLRSYPRCGEASEHIWVPTGAVTLPKPDAP